MHTVLTKNAELPFKGGLAFLLGERRIVCKIKELRYFKLFRDVCKVINYSLGLALGADAYITKPFSNAELVAKVKELLEKTYEKARR